MDESFLHVITGPMFAGKTVRLLSEITSLSSQGKSVRVLTHAIDTRRGIGDISTHDGLILPAHPVSSAASILDHVDGVSPVAIDEAQFFGEDLIPVVEELLNRNLRVLVSGLCVTFDGRPFTPLPELMVVANKVSKLVATCWCGAPAPYHQSVRSLGDALTIDKEQVGGSESYEARCRLHFTGAIAYGM
ncbi:MAG: hypothetical protein QMB98_05915 [Flaviflexus sp.]|uniref:thymidine kinase n=1 Tax=Flaviflexus sp. TaxID=1969482 RepID=UPI00352CBD88